MTSRLPALPAEVAGLAVPPAEPAKAAVIILNYNGRRHLATCLRAVLALDELRSPEAVVVADNGSGDDSLDLVAAEFPGVRLLELGSNLGFAGGNNRAAECVESDFLLFLNNDTRTAPDVLRHLAAHIGGDVACSGARLVSWDGRRLDFDGGGATFTGHGHALGFGRSVPRRRQPVSPTLFCSGAAMLVHRATFLAVGGFDSDYFFYYEDVDLGWRLWLAGYRVLHVPAAVVHHRHHGTADRLPSLTAARLYERNALATVVKDYDDRNLVQVLPAALALAAHRAGADSAVIGAADPSPASGLPVPGQEWAGWSALEPLGLDLADLAARRARVQRLRRRPDSQILPLLSWPLVPVPPTRDGWSALRLAVDHFGLMAVFGAFPEVRRTGRRGGSLVRLAAAFRDIGPVGLMTELLRRLSDPTGLAEELWRLLSDPLVLVASLRRHLGKRLRGRR